MKNKYYTKDKGFKFPRTLERKKALEFLFDADYEFNKKIDKRFFEVLNLYQNNRLYRSWYNIFIKKYDYYKQILYYNAVYKRIIDNLKKLIEYK